MRRDWHRFSFVPGSLRLDGLLSALLLLLMIYGLVVLYSAADQDTGMVLRQSIRLFIGTVALLVACHIPPSWYRRWAPWLYGLGLLMLVATLLVGVGRGAQRWLDLGVIRFQPAEAMKLAVPLMLATWLHQRPLPPSWRDLMVCGLILAVPLVLIVQQPDLGTALLIGVGGATVLFVAGLRWRLILAASLVMLAALPVLWARLHEYQRSRVLTFLKPESDPLGEGWNVIQSKIAVGTGGLSGRGWMGGTQSRLEFLPEPHTDFILAVLAEEFGFVGISLLLALYLAIILRTLYLARQARDPFGRMLASSLMFLFFLYLVVNAGMVTGLLPVVGVPLPLISYGGTSAVTLLVGFGIVMGLYSRRKFMS